MKPTFEAAAEFVAGRMTDLMIGGASFEGALTQVAAERKVQHDTIRRYLRHANFKEDMLETWSTPRPAMPDPLNERRSGIVKGRSCDSVLVISDQHAPYNHPDMLEFLYAIKGEYAPDTVVNIGDELDYHAMSFHESDPDLMSAGDELDAGRRIMQEMEKIFPEMFLVDSNHGSMKYRKAKAGGIPRHFLRSYREILGVGEGWNWSWDLVLNLSNGHQCFFAHSYSKNSRASAEKLGMNFVQGHFHSSFEIQYSSSPTKLLWGMNVGCLIDPTSYAFAYCARNISRPIIGTGVILRGQPKLLPMLLDEKNRWKGVLV